MKFRDVSERVKGGKLDPLSKMGKSKLTGQEIAKYYKDNPKAKQAARDKTVKKAIELALDLGGAQSYAIKEIEKLKRGLSKMPVVQQALRTANEDMTSTSSVAMPEIPLGRKHKVMKRKELEENKEKLSPAKKQYYDFNIMRTQLYRKVKAKTKAHKFAIDDLMLMTSPKVIEGMYKQNPTGFTRMMDKMYPNEKAKMTKGDFTVLGDFIDARGKVQKGKGHKVDESAELNEASMTYRIRKAQKPEIDNMMKGARMMKLKVIGNRVKTVGADPKRKTGDTEITVSGTAKNLRDFDAVVRGKSSYGDPSLVKEDFDLLEKQFAIKPGMDYTAPYSPKYNKKFRKSAPGGIKNKEEIVAMIRKKKDGKHKIKDGNTSLIVRSLARIMNQDRRPAAKKGAAFGKGRPQDEMNAPEIKKMIDIVSKGITVTKKGDKITRNKPEINAFYDVDTAIRDEVYDVINMASDGTLRSLVYNESTELNEESATMKKVRQVIKKKGMMNIDGMKLDLTTASMIASVYDKVNPMNKKRMDSLKLPQLVNLTMKVAGKGKMKKEDAVERAKELADLKAKHKREIEQEKDEIAATKQTNESLWRNIHNKRKRGEKMRKPGEKGAPKPGDFERARGEAVSPAQLERMSRIQNKSTDFIKVPKLNSKQQSYMKKIKKRFPKLPEPVNYEIMRLTHKGNQVDSQKYVEIGNLYDKDYVGGTGGKFIQKLRNMGARLPQGHMGEAVSPAQQAAIAISKKERGEKPKNECADEKDFKPHKMYKGDKEVMANTYADHVKYDKMGYTHEKPKKEALDAKDKPFVKDLVKKLRGGSKTHAKQADDLEKAMNTESMSRARRDAMRDMGTRKDRDDDGNPVATADDRKAADKNVVMQIRRVTDLSKPAQIELRNGKKVMLKPADAKMMMKKFDAIRKPQDRLKVQNAMNDKKMTVQGLKRLLGR